MVAGEASGDLHGSNLIKEIKIKDSQADIRCWGGAKMQAAGGKLIKDYKSLAFMGFVEVVANLRTILQNLRFCKKDILAFIPDVLVLIDYPGFNLPIAKWAKKQGLKVVFYISPQVWAWKEKRVQTIKENVDRMIVILPFEKQFYQKWGYDVDYVGHPLIQVIDDFKKKHHIVPGNIISEAIHKAKGIIALLPGSRKQEIEKKLPLMLAASSEFPDWHFVVAKTPSIDEEFYITYTKGYNVTLLEDKTYDLLSTASAALVTSGTATLETALFGVPQAICYKGNSISFLIAKQLVKIKYIGLVNLIMDKEVVKELIQNMLTVENITKELTELLYNTSKISQIKSDYNSLHHLLSIHGNASENAARIVIETAS